MSAYYLISFVGGFLGAVVVASFEPISMAIGWLFVLFSIVFCFLSGRYRLGVLVFVSLGCAIGIFRYSAVESRFDRTTLHAGEVASLLAIIVDEPQDRGDTIRFVAHHPLSDSRILVTTARYPTYSYGDTVSLSGKIKEPKNFSDDFDWVAYLAKDGIAYTIDHPHLELVSRDSGSMRGMLYRAKGRFIASIRRHLPEPEASFAAGITIGARDGLPADLKEQFRITGTSHIVALSGYNISLVAKAVQAALSGISKFLSQTVGTVAIIAFTLMTGAEAATVRAAIMALILVVAERSARTYDVTRALVAAGVFMVAYDPKILVFDLSFQLSFLASVGIIYLAPLIKERIARMGFGQRLADLLSGTLGAQLAVLPLILVKTGQLSLIALVVNILILPAIPYAMGSAFTLALMALIYRLAALPFAYISYALLSYVLGVVRIGSSVPFAAVSLAIPWWCAVIIYLLSAWYLYGIYRSKIVVVHVEGVDIEIVDS